MQELSAIARRYFPVSRAARMVFVPHAHYRYSGLCAYIALAAVRWPRVRTVFLLTTDHYGGRNCTPARAFTAGNLTMAPFPGVASCDAAAIDAEHSWQFLLPLLRHFTRGRQVTVHLLLLRQAQAGITETILRGMRADPSAVLIGNSDLYHGAPAGASADMGAAVNVLLRTNARLPPSACGPGVFSQFLQVAAAVPPWATGAPHVACAYNSSQNIHRLAAGAFTPAALFAPYTGNDRTVGYASLVYYGGDGGDGDGDGGSDDGDGGDESEDAHGSRLSPYEQYLLTATAYAALQPMRWSVPAILLRARAGVFVTIHAPGGALRGCVGTLSATGVVAAAAAYARAAAYRDGRFPPMSRAELAACTLTVTTLSPLRPLSMAAYLRTFVPGKHGVHLTTGGKGAYFLPVVSADMAAETGTGTNTTDIPRRLLSMLCAKAGLAGTCYNNGDAALELNTGTAMLHW